VVVPPQGEADKGTAAAALTSDYPLKTGACFGRALANYLPVAFPMIFYLIFVNAIYIALAFIPAGTGNAFTVLLSPALDVGFMVVALDQLQRRKWRFRDFFAGFNGQLYGAIFGNNLILGGIILLLLLPTLVVFLLHTGFYAALPHSALRSIVKHDFIEFFPLYFGLLNLLVAMSYVWGRGFFCRALIIEHGYGAMEAVRGSWRMTRGRFWALFRILLLLALIQLAPAAVMLVLGMLQDGRLLIALAGLLITYPLMPLVAAAVYLQAAARQPALAVEA
jgi:hypothetical protein